ncbi:MAG: hypothetical protein KF713_18395 [Turneriella sp.]|nr:hypothetical protein [Turneriella sp.]
MFRLFPIFVCMFCGIIAAPLYAYVDPGSGSILVQAVLAGFLGALLAVKIYWKKLVKLFSKQPKSEEENHP